MAGPAHLPSPSTCYRETGGRGAHPPAMSCVAAIPRLPDGYKGTPSPSPLPRSNPSRYFFPSRRCSLPCIHPKLMSPRHRHRRSQRHYLRAGGRPGGPRPLASLVPGMSSSRGGSYACHCRLLHRVHRRPPSSIASSPGHLCPPPRRFRWNHCELLFQKPHSPCSPLDLSPFSHPHFGRRGQSSSSRA